MPLEDLLSVDSKPLNHRAHAAEDFDTTWNREERGCPVLIAVGDDPGKRLMPWPIEYAGAA